MSTRKAIVTGIIVAGMLASPLVLADVQGGEAQDAAWAASQAKISFTQAIAAAESHAGGKAVRAELENENGTPVYGVVVASAKGLADVKVDVRDGKVLSAQPEDGQHEGLSDEGENERGER